MYTLIFKSYNQITFLKGCSKSHSYQLSLRESVTSALTSTVLGEGYWCCFIFILDKVSLFSSGWSWMIDSPLSSPEYWNLPHQVWVVYYSYQPDGWKVLSHCSSIHFPDQKHLHFICVCMFLVWVFFVCGWGTDLETGSHYTYIYTIIYYILYIY